ncbi:3089_t:CDS:2 [Funneliformis mosseae]|uniref:3089_t:CDS:1 n=1 Tax=Funneliformis mosseae TaxID=27381 RepID=A0A9N9GXU8_FUNMO|nr:3089_t:CDS:2 [Funneliformis mosseae]
MEKSRFSEFIKDIEYDYLNISPEKAWDDLENTYTRYLDTLEQTISDESESIEVLRQIWTSTKKRTRNNFFNNYLQMSEKLAERKVQTISHSAACNTISANVEKVEKNVISRTKSDMNDAGGNSQNPLVISEDETEAFTSASSDKDLKRKRGDNESNEELASVEKPNVIRRLDSTKEDNTEENLINSVIHASNTFGQVEFPLYYSKLKSLWDNQDAEAYHVIDLGNKEILTQIHELLDEDELKLLHNMLVLDDENMFIDEKAHKYLELSEKTKNMKGESEKFNESIAKMEEIVHQLDGLPEKYHYLSNTFPIPAQHYDQSKMPDMFIIKSVSSHLDTIIKMNGAMINTPEQNDFKADGVLELFERPMQIPLFLLEVSEGPKNLDLDKINEDRQKLMKEGVFAINKFMTRTELPTYEVCSKLKVFLVQGFSDNVEIGQMIFIEPGLYLFAPFTIPALTIPTFTDNLEHVPRLIRTLLCLRYNVLKEIKIFKNFSKEGQRYIAKPLTKYATGVTPGWHKAVTFAEFLPKISKEGKKRGRGRGRGRGQEA